MNPFAELIMLGTGEATATKCYNTCFILRTDKSTVLVDGGGGNGILCQLERAGISIQEISSIFLTHSHSDHILGIVWILRMIGEYVCNGIVPQSKIKLFSNRETLEALVFICRCVLSLGVIQALNKYVEYVEVTDGQIVDITPDIQFHVFDTKTIDTMQTGFNATLPDGQTLVCFGDAPCTDQIASWGKNTDWMLCEAFCLDRDKDVFHPHEIHHNTVAETAEMASKLNVKNLILYHTEDVALDVRKQSYITEASLMFNGNVYVPNDLETISIY